jgi:hypothetical protein
LRPVDAGGRSTEAAGLGDEDKCAEQVEVEHRIHEEQDSRKIDDYDKYYW